MPKWSPNRHQNSTKMLPKIGLKMRPVPKGPWRCFIPLFWRPGTHKMCEFCGRGVKNHMFAHFTAFSRKVTIFTPKLDILGLQKLPKMLPKTPKNIVPVLGCFFDAFWCPNDPKKRPQNPQNLDKTTFGAPIFSPTQHKVIPKSIWAPK